MFLVIFNALIGLVQPQIVLCDTPNARVRENTLSEFISSRSSGPLFLDSDKYPSLTGRHLPAISALNKNGFPCRPLSSLTRTLRSYKVDLGLGLVTY